MTVGEQPRGPVPIDDRYGPGALVTPANMITMLRLIMTPALLVMAASWPHVTGMQIDIHRRIAEPLAWSGERE